MADSHSPFAPHYRAHVIWTLFMATILTLGLFSISGCQKTTPADDAAASSASAVAYVSSESAYSSMSGSR